MSGAGSGGQTPGKGKRRQGAGDWLTPPRNQVEAELDQALNQAASADTDEVALRRVWSRLSQLPELVPTRIEAPAPRRTRWTWIAGATVAGAAAAVVLMMVGSPSFNRIRSRSGQTGPQVAPTIASHDDLDRSVLVAPATVRTASGEVLHLSLKGGTEVTVTPNSTLALDEDDRPAVTAGEVQFHVPPQAPGHTFTVRAKEYRVVVVGTRFSVRIDAGRAGVGVEEGTVEVWNDAGRLVRLTHGLVEQRPRRYGSSCAGAGRGNAVGRPGCGAGTRGVRSPQRQYPTRPGGSSAACLTRRRGRLAGKLLA